MRRLHAVLRCLALACAFVLPGPGWAADCPPQAQFPDPSTIPRSLRDARDRGMLWRMEQDGRTSWLYGTAHVAEREWMFPGPTVVAALRGVDSVALELNLLDPAVMAALRQAVAARPDAPPLPPGLAGRLEAQARAACAGPELQALRPEMQVFTLLSLAARRQGLDPAYGIDMALAGMAVGLRKPLLSLETPAQQISEMVSDDPARVAERVAAGLDHLERGDAAQVLTTLAYAWADGRLNLLENYPRWCACVESAAERAEYERMVDGRNPAMADAIAAQHRAGRSVFAAVGALHMAGPGGLPALLEKKGFRVQRVAFPQGSAPAR